MTGLNEEVRVFSKALFKLGQELGNLSGYRLEFEEFVDHFKKLSSFRSILFSPRVLREEKREMLDRVFGQYFSEGFLSFLKVVILKRRQDILLKIQEDFNKLVDNQKKVLRASLISAVSLDKDVLSRLESVLESKFSRKVILSKPVVNSSILGGIIIKVDDIRIDLSLASSLLQLKEQILGIKLGGAI